MAATCRARHLAAAIIIINAHHHLARPRRLNLCQTRGPKWAAKVACGKAQWFWPILSSACLAPLPASLSAAAAASKLKRLQAGDGTGCRCCLFVLAHFLPPTSQTTCPPARPPLTLGPSAEPMRPKLDRKWRERRAKSGRAQFLVKWTRPSEARLLFAGRRKRAKLSAGRAKLFLVPGG